MKKLILLTATLSLFAMPLAYGKKMLVSKSMKPKMSCSDMKFSSLYAAVQAGCAQPKVDCKVARFSSHQAAVAAGCAAPKSKGKK